MGVASKTKRLPSSAPCQRTLRRHREREGIPLGFFFRREKSIAMASLLYSYRNPGGAETTT
jgi:hypothetical protein